MVKQPTAEQSEFTMSSEDFPALPGTNIGTGGAPSNTIGGSNTTNAMDASATNTSLSNCNVMSSSGSTNDDSDAKQHGVKTTREGVVSNSKLIVS